MNTVQERKELVSLLLKCRKYIAWFATQPMMLSADKDEVINILNKLDKLGIK